MDYDNNLEGRVSTLERRESLLAILIFTVFISTLQEKNRKLKIPFIIADILFILDTSFELYKSVMSKIKG